MSLFRQPGKILMLWSHKPVAPWQDDAWVEQMRAQLRPNAFLRMIRNHFVSSESSFVEMEWFDACVDDALRPVLADPSLPVWVGVDASVKRDSTAIVAVTWDAEAKRVRLVWHRIFQPTAKEPLDFEATIETTLRDLRQRFAVCEVRFDPWQMQAVAQRLRAAGLPMVELAQSVPNLTESSTCLYEAVKAQSLSVYRDDAIRLAVSHAVAAETTRGWRITKEKASHKIDVVVAMAMAVLAAVRNGAAAAPLVCPDITLTRESPWRLGDSSASRWS